MTVPPSIDEGSSPLQRLQLAGFRKAGHWHLSDLNLQLHLTDLGDSRNVLYAFVGAGAVMYVGKTVQPLRRRLYGYQFPVATQSTNLKGHGLSKDALARGTEVDVYVLPDNGLLYYGGFHVNLAAGLEDSLVATLKPLWNRAGV